MKKALMTFILTLFLLATTGAVLGEELAKEGSITGKNYISGTFTVIAMGEERLQMNYEGTGTMVNDAGKGFIHLASVHALGTLHAVKGAFEETGFLVMTATDGDKVYAAYKSSGTLGKAAKGTLTYTGGTGRYTGIQGEGEFTRYSLRNAKEGVWTSVSIVKASYKLP